MYKKPTDSTFQAEEFKLFVTNPEIFESVRECRKWAEKELVRQSHRYSGYIPRQGFSIMLMRNYTDKSKIECSICQPQWSADHCGEARDTGSLAIIQAVLEITSGF